MGDRGRGKLDAETLESHIPRDISELTGVALRFHFEQDNTTPVSKQSWLGTLARIAGGGGYAFFEDTEVFRCAAGNQSLGAHLAAHLDIDRHRVTNIRSDPRSISTSRAASGKGRSTSPSSPCRPWPWRS